MTTGEFEYDTIFINDQELVDEGLSLLLPELTAVIWVIFIVVMPVLFNDLLVKSLLASTCSYLVHVLIVNGVENLLEKLN